MGFSPEKLIFGLIFFSFSSIFLSSLSLIKDFISQREIGCQKLDLDSSPALEPSGSSSYLVLFCFADALGLLSVFKLILGNEKLNEYKIHTMVSTNKMMINDFVASPFPQNMICNIAITGHDIYHQSFSYLLTSPSMIGKFIIADIIIMMTTNCLIINLIKYHFAMMRIPTRKQSAKKT